MDKRYLWIIGCLAVIGLVFACRNNASDKKDGSWQMLQGSVFHTFYHITYESDYNYSHEIDSLFKKFDGSLSMYNDTSIITRMNRNEEAVADHYFREVFRKANYVSQKTDGAFDMTVAPLVNLWGFGFRKNEQVSSQAVDSILQFVGYQTVSLDDEGHLQKQDPRTILDASSIAKGYMSDVIAQFLESEGIANYMVEIGGEIALKGVNHNGNAWTIGIARPVNDTLQQDHGYQDYLQLTSGGLATSGNYRKFYDKGGKRYGHTIDPHTGYPIQTDVLSATVFAPDCMTADAFATAFMVLGKEKALEVMANEPTVEGYLIIPSAKDSTELEVVYSPGFEHFLER